MGFYDAVDNIDQGSLEQNAITYPYVQFVNGKATMKQLNNVTYTGGWFIPADVVASAPEGWGPLMLVHGNGASTEGYALKDLDVAVLRQRRRWLATNKGQTIRFPWAKYDDACAASDNKRATGHTQVAVVIKGLEKHGIFVLTIKGMTGKAWGGIIINFSKLVVKGADALARAAGKTNKFAARAFWLTIGPKRTEAGAPVYETVGTGKDTSQVTPPCLLGVGEKPTEDEIQKRYVGNVLLKELNALWIDASIWAEDLTWDGEQSAPEASKEVTEIDAGPEMF